MKTFAIMVCSGMLASLVSFTGLSGEAMDEHRPIFTATVVANSDAVSNAVALPASITLNGVANLDRKCALLTIHSGSAPALSVVLQEGEAKASVRVLHISMTNARVLVDNAGRTELLAFSGCASVAALPEPDADHVPVPSVPSPETGER